MGEVAWYFRIRYRVQLPQQVKIIKLKNSLSFSDNEVVNHDNYVSIRVSFVKRMIYCRRLKFKLLLI